MLQAARDYIKANKVGPHRDLDLLRRPRPTTGTADSGRWQALRDAFQEFPQGVRFHLLAYPQPASRNLSVRVTDVRRQKTGDAAELLISLKLARQDGGDGPRKRCPVQFEIDGARSEVAVDLAGAEAELKDHRIPLEKGKERGWGRVSIPADANPADNDFYFVFEQPVPRRAIVVAEDAAAARPLQLAAAISPDPARPVLGRGARAGPARRRRLGPGRPGLVAGPAAGQGRGRADPGVRRARRLGDLLPAPGAGARARSTASAGRPGRSRRPRPRRGLAGRRGPAGQHPERRAAAGRPAPGPALLRALRRRVDGAGHAQGRRPAAGPGRRPTAAAPISARRRRPAATPRWRPTAWSCTSWCSGRWPPAPPSLGTTRQLVGRRADPGRPRPLGARGRRRGGDLDRIRRAPGRLFLRRPAAGRQPLGRRGVGRPCWPTAASTTCSAASTSLAVDDRAGSISSLIQEIWRMFLDRHDGRHGGRGRPLPAQDGQAPPPHHSPHRRLVRIPPEPHHERLPIAHIPLDALDGGPLGRWPSSSRPSTASSPGGAAATASRWACWNCCGWPSSRSSR